jgi:hypothetical protein
VKIELAPMGLERRVQVAWKVRKTPTGPLVGFGVEPTRGGALRRAKKLFPDAQLVESAASEGLPEDESERA